MGIKYTLTVTITLKQFCDVYNFNLLLDMEIG